MKKILFADYHPWDSPIQVGSHKYARLFAQDGWRVFWIMQFINPNRLIRRNDEDRSMIALWKKGIHPVAENVLEYAPFSYLPYINFPFLRSDFAARNAYRFTFPPLKKVLQRSGFDHVDVLFISTPRSYSILNVVSYDKLIYRMSDNAKGFRGNPDNIARMEAMLSARSDIVFVTAKSLLPEAQKLSADVVYLPNGVDFDLFDRDQGEPEEIKSLPHPRVIYVGAISDWLDLELVQNIAVILPHFSFVIIGPILSGTESRARRNRMDNLSRLSNCFYLGPQAHEKIPAYLKHSDIGWIPFKTNELTNSISPIKLYEYAAAGLPVVSSKMTESYQFKDVVSFYASQDEAVQRLCQAHNADPSARERRKAWAKQNSWQSRYSDILANI